MKPIDCAARNEGRTCLSCEAWEAGVRAGQTVLLAVSMPDLDDETEREITSDFFESLGGKARVVIGEPLRFNVHGAFDLDGEDDGEP